MNYQDVVSDFANRTKKNLEIIEKLKDENPENEIFEVTQLINSMLGLLIFPQQRYIDRIPETSIKDLKEKGWAIPKTKGNFPEAKNLKDMVRLLRNAIAHFNIKFTVNGLNEINGIIVWNINRGRKTWEAELPLKDLRQITRKFVTLLIENNNRPKIRK